ncbi:MAG: nucleoside deaminase [Thermoanaerobaculia bacterium]|nr:nucleoside deaminase [Thermoanaerobaculia bacterium]
MSTLTIEIPDWIEEAEERIGDRSLGGRERMRWTIELSRKSVESDSGGPFAAAVFDLAGRNLVAAGINLVEPSGLSVAHAEIVALMRAQRREGTFDLSRGGDYELVASTEPCAMCLGAIPWSGVRSLRCGALGKDAEAIGFDEGAKPESWERALEERGIEVRRGILRKEARSVLESYLRRGGRIYSPFPREEPGSPGEG